MRVINKGKTNEYVYDISLDGTVVNALGMNIAHNTDGFNFKMPETFRYTKDHSYYGKGLNRDVTKGKAYDGLVADVMEFDDLFMKKKMGLGIDEIVLASLNYSRKNYSDLFPDGKIKKVGNTIKSRRMSGYIEVFMDKAIELLLHGDGKGFLSYYYEYIDKIYNYQIPLKDIASKGKIKKTLDDYIKDCKTLTKSGGKKARQAWYELVMQANMKVNLDDTIYYINTGTKKNHSDVKRITHQYVYDKDKHLVELTSLIKRDILKSECEKKGIEYKSLKTKDAKELLKKHIIKEEDEIVLNCKMIPLSLIESETDVLSNDEFEYNVEKYIDMFNKRIKILLVCFSPTIRDRILITNPSDRQYFTDEESKLVSGYPNRPTDQDTYEQLMTMERKEIEYWLRIGEKPPFIEECGMDWDKIVNDYVIMKAEEDNALFKEENTKYLDALSKLTVADIEAYEEDDVIPQSLLDIVTLGSDLHFYFNKIPNMTPSTGGYVFDDLSIDNNSDEIEDAVVFSQNS